MDLARRLEAHLAGLIAAGQYTSKELEQALDGVRVALQERRTKRGRHAGPR